VSSRGWAYWLVYPTERRLVPKIKRFREWLIAEMQKAIEEHDGGWGFTDEGVAAAAAE
jgi:LysR family glycine cleavage system transcriptional activator